MEPFRIFHHTDYEEVTILADNGEIELNSWWVENDLSNPTIILLHGLTSSKHSPDILLPMGMMNKSNFNLLAIDMRDHGESTCEDVFMLRDKMKLTMLSLL